MSGSIPAGGQMMPLDCANFSLRDLLGSSRPITGASLEIPGGQAAGGATGCDSVPRDCAAAGTAATQINEVAITPTR
jgi:hypothetical protein